MFHEFEDCVSQGYQFIMPGGNIQGSISERSLMGYFKIFLQRFCVFFVSRQGRCVLNSAETGELYGFKKILSKLFSFNAVLTDKA